MVDHRNHTQTITAFEGGPQRAFALPERWRLERVLGVGGQAQVWLAVDTELQERVAVKVLARPDRPTEVERLKREVRVGRKLQHENLVQIYELVDAGASMAVIMEYLEGGSLSQRLGGESLQISEVERIAEALLEGLACLHREDIVHRDVKPSNVLFDAAGVPKLADFGTLSAMDEAGDLTATNLTVGTPAYMSPEQVRGEEPAPQSDLYSLGVTLYHLLVGKRPFEGGSEFDVARRQVTDEAAPIRRDRGDCPRWLARFVHRLLEKDPKNRWKDAGQALAAYSARRWRPTQRLVLRSVAVVATVVALGSLGLVAADRLSELQPSVENGELVVRNAFGRNLWRKAIEGLCPVTVAADLSSQRGLEVLGGASTGRPGERRLHLYLFGGDGATLRRFRVTTEFAGKAMFPGMSEDLQLTSLELLDLGKDLGVKLGWIATDRSWYPGLVGLWFDHPSPGPRMVLVNSGHCRAVSTIDIDGDGQKEMVIVGINNKLGFQAFVGIIDPRRGGARSPELMSPDAATGGEGALLSYVVLGEENEQKIGLEGGMGSKGPLRVLLDARTLEIGPDGMVNGVAPEDSLKFWAEVIQVGDILRTTEAPWAAEVEEVADKQELMWPRPEFQGAAALMLAQALAEGGRPGEGAEILQYVRSEGVHLRRINRRMGEMYLLQGARALGRKALHQAIASMGRGFGPIDECIDLGLDDALNQDDDNWFQTSKILKSLQFDSYRRQLEVVFQFFGGRFSKCRLDLKMAAGVHHQAFVLKHWAAIEEGRADEETLAELEKLRLRPECSSLATLALARWEVLNHQLGENADQAGQALWTLEDRAPASWPDTVYLPLAQWAHATVLEAEGRTDEARSQFKVVAEAAPATFFGRGTRS